MPVLHGDRHDRTGAREISATLSVDQFQPFVAEMRAFRRDFHRHPETRFAEVRTAGIVAQQLRAWGYDVTEGVGGTGVVGTLRGERPGRSIGLRADMDALDIHEENTFEHVSTLPGTMHACGHDGHTAMLLGAAHALAERRSFAGTVHVVFQPAEEGGRGAKAMIADNFFERFPCAEMYAMHNKPGIAYGKFGICTGPMMAACDYWTVRFYGSGGHGGSAPHLATDATIPAAQFILTLQTIVGRNVPAAEAAVISVGHLVGGTFTSPNVMPPEVLVRGTARWYAAAVGTTIARRMHETAQLLAAAHGCTADVVYENQVPPMVNHAAGAAIAAGTAAALVGAENVDTAMRPVTGGEDFAYFLQARPGALIMIGNGMRADGTFDNLHTPRYEFNDDILALGAAYWVTLAERVLA
jgi:amidohydrolase